VGCDGNKKAMDLCGFRKDYTQCYARNGTLECLKLEDGECIGKGRGESCNAWPEMLEYSCSIFVIVIFMKSFRTGLREV